MATPTPRIIPLTITAITAAAVIATTVIVIPLLVRQGCTAVCVKNMAKITKLTTQKIVASSMRTGPRSPEKNCTPKNKSIGSSMQLKSAERATAMKGAAAAEDVLPAARIVAAAEAAAAAAADPTTEMKGTTPTQI